ncbi:MAG: Holliday junction resolvase-like protein [Nanoarchaeota archaeon]
MVELTTFSLVILSGLVFFLFWIFYRLGEWRKEAEWQQHVPHLRSDIADKQRSGIKGNVAEMFAPYLPKFPFKASECKFIGNPIDYVVFEGLDERKITGIHFIDVKTDSSELKAHQKQIKELISSLGSQNITFQTFHLNTSDTT